MLKKGLILEAGVCIILYYYLFKRRESSQYSILYDVLVQSAGFAEDEDVGSLQWAKPLQGQKGAKEIGMDWSRGRWDKPPTVAAGVITIAIFQVCFFFLCKNVR